MSEETLADKLKTEVIWNRQSMRVMNFANKEQAVPRLFDVILAGYDDGEVASAFGDETIFDWDDVEIINMTLRYETTAALVKDAERIIKENGVDKYKVMIRTDDREYEAEFYGEEQDYLLKDLVVSVTDPHLRNALYTLDRLVTTQRALEDNMEEVVEMLQEILDFDRDCNITEFSAWNHLVERVEFLYSHYLPR